MVSCSGRRVNRVESGEWRVESSFWRKRRFAPSGELSLFLSSREGSGGLKGLLEGGDGVGAEQLAQGDAQHLTALVEDGLHDAAEELLVAAEGVDVVARHADDGRLHLGWRVEDGGLDGEEVLDIVPRLDEHGEDAVGLRTGLGSHAQRHLVLDHARAAGDEVAVVEHLEEDLRRDVVGVVAREHKLAAAEELAEVHAEEVAGDESPTLTLPSREGREPYPRPFVRREGCGECGEVLAEVGDGLAVDFYGADGARLREQELREDAHAGAYLEYGNVGARIDGVGDAAGYRQVGQEVLTKVFLRFYLLHDS